MSGIGHNQVSFKAAVEENLRGLYVSHLNALVRATRDPRLGQMHRLVLAEIIERTDNVTGMAYPGWDKLAANIVYYDHFQPRHYTAGTISVAIKELKKFARSRSGGAGARPLRRRQADD